MHQGLHEQGRHTAGKEYKAQLRCLLRPQRLSVAPHSDQQAVRGPLSGLRFGVTGFIAPSAPWKQQRAFEPHQGCPNRPGVQRVRTPLQERLPKCFGDV